MTDKEKIRAEIVDRINCYKGSEVNFHNRISELENILAFIDSMQEEPKKCMYSKDNYTDEDRKILCDGCEEDCNFKPNPFKIKKHE